MKLNFFLFIALLIVSSLRLNAQTEGLAIETGDSTSAIVIDSASIVASNTPPVSDDDTTYDVPSEDYFELKLRGGSKPYPIPPVSAVNVLPYKRVYRDIDLNDSANAVFAITGNYFVDAFVKGIKDGKVTPYDANASVEDPSGDNFKVRLSVETAMMRLIGGDSITKVEQTDNDGNVTGYKDVRNEYDPSKITGFRLKEDIFYDNNRSRVETRIIGIAPLVSKQGVDLKNPAFWLYYPQARKVLASTEIMVPELDERPLSFDDILIRRHFKSKIWKESKPYNSMTAKNDDFAIEKQPYEDSERIEQEIKDYKGKVFKR